MRITFIVSSHTFKLFLFLCVLASAMFFKSIPSLLVLAGFITLTCASPTAKTPSVTRPSPEAQPAPTSIAGLLALIRGDAAGAQFRFVNTQNNVLDVAHFITSDNAPLFSTQNNPSGINSAVSS